MQVPRATDIIHLRGRLSAHSWHSASATKLIVLVAASSCSGQTGMTEPSSQILRRTPVCLLELNWVITPTSLFTNFPKRKCTEAQLRVTHFIPDQTQNNGGTMVGSEKGAPNIVHTIMHRHRIRQPRTMIHPSARVATFFNSDMQSSAQPHWWVMTDDWWIIQESETTRTKG